MYLICNLTTGILAFVVGKSVITIPPHTTITVAAISKEMAVARDKQLIDIIEKKFNKKEK